MSLAVRLCADRFFASQEKVTMTTQTVEKTAFLTQAEVAEMLHQDTTATLRWWRHQNCGPKSVRIGKRVLYRVSDVEMWLDAQEAATARGGVL
jgi:predicted DNA-binding transcriptional regulator AlpA